MKKLFFVYFDIFILTILIQCLYSLLPNIFFINKPNKYPDIPLASHKSDLSRLKDYCYILHPPKKDRFLNKILILFRNLLLLKQLPNKVEAFVAMLHCGLVNIHHKLVTDTDRDE